MLFPGDACRACAAGVVCALLVTGLARAQTWAPNETLVSAQKDMVDPEYNHARAQFVWSSADGKLWVGNIDRETGAFYPPDGKGLLVDAGTLTADDVTLTFNGPEWVFSADGDGIAYTKFSSTHHNDRTARLGYARPLPDGNFSADFLGPDVARKAPFGSETSGDPRPRITYVDKDGNHYWRYIADAASEQQLVGPVPEAGAVRHVRGANAVVYLARAADGVRQAYRRDLDLGVVTQLTSDPGDKTEVWMWLAPEFAGEPIFMVMVGSAELRIYRKPAGATAWAPIRVMRAAPRDSFTSPEPFVYKNRSYVFMAYIKGNDGFSSEIWVSNIDSANPIFKRVSDNVLLRARSDPEVFVTNHGAFIYYNRRTLDTSGRKPKFCAGVACSEGIYRADTGL